MKPRNLPTQSAHHLSGLGTASVKGPKGRAPRRPQAGSHLTKLKRLDDREEDSQTPASAGALWPGSRSGQQDPEEMGAEIRR